MSTGIDKEFIQEYYQRMTDSEVIRILKQDLTGLTSEAKEVIREEIKRRNLGIDLSKVVDSQEEMDISEKVYDPESCPVDEASRIWLEKSFQTLLLIFGEENTQNRQILTPERIHFPIKYDGSERSAFETLEIIARQMEVSVERIMLDFYDENLRGITEGTPGGLYWGKGENDNFEISLALRELDEPEHMIATLAHEIAHIKLLGENFISANEDMIFHQE